MNDPVVDVVIPVHTDRRPIARAIASVLTTATTPTRVNVVCHNIEPARIAEAAGAWADDARVRFLHVEDAVPSPAGPINAGLAAATGEFTALLGSDDEYEPGAVDAWVEVARRDGAELVIPPLRTRPGGPTKSPPVRPFRQRRLDGVRDRLAYRTVQLGLVSRARFGDVRMTEGLRTGEDIVQGASLWFSDARISLTRGPGYLIHEDDPAERTSSSPKPAAESLRFLDAVLSPGFLARLTTAQRESFCIKLLRTHLMDILGASLRAGAPADDLAALSEAATRILDVAPSSLGPLSRREARIVRELVGGRDRHVLAVEHGRLTDFRRPANLLPSSLAKALHREAPLRILPALALMR